MRITKFQRWVLRWICRKLVVQGYHHQSNITEYHKIMAECAREQFYEDNKSTLDGLLKECHEKSLETG